MASTDSTYPRGGYLSSGFAPSVKKVTWDICQFRRKVSNERDSKTLKSDDFHFANATWNLYAKSYNYTFNFGITVRIPPDELFTCCYTISCRDTYGQVLKKWQSRFECENTDSYSEEIGSLYSHDADKFAERGAFIVCEIEVMKSIIKEANSGAEIGHSSGSGVVEAPDQIELPESDEEEISTASVDCEICQDFKKLLVSEEFSDVTIQIGDQKFKAHWSILAARSSVFASMFRHDTKEKATGIVDVEDCELSSFPVFLEYVYCGNTEKISSENVFNLYISADKYDVQDLKRKCLEFMMANLSVDTFCETLRLCLQHSEKKLLNLATEFFIRNFQEIILTPKWQSFILENPIQGNELFIKAAKTMI